MKSKNIYLRPLLVSDTNNYLKALENEEILFMTGTKKKSTIEELEKHIESITNDNTREDYAICQNTTGEMIGELSILDIDYDNSSAGFRIALNCQNVMGKGLGSEAIELIKQYVFKSLLLNRLQLEVYSHNTRGIRAYKKCGFKQEGILRETLFYKGAYSDEIIMSIIKSDFTKS